MKKLYVIKRRGGKTTEDSLLTSQCPYHTGKGAYASDIRSAQFFKDAVIAFAELNEAKENTSFNEDVTFYVSELIIEETEVIFDVKPKPSISGGFDA